MNRRVLFKILASGIILFSQEKSGLSNEMFKTRKTFTIDGFESSFSTIIDNNLTVHQFKEYTKTTAPFIRLWEKGFDEDNFSIEISCFNLDFYAESVNIGIGLAAIWGGKNIDFDRKSLHISYASVIYKEDYNSEKLTRLHIFKNLNDFVVFCVNCSDTDSYEHRYRPYVDKVINNFTFEIPRDNASQVSIVKLDSRSTILLPFDWRYRDVIENARKDYDPKNTLTNAYFFENKLMPKNSLPVIALAHYRDDIEEARYLLDIYKDVIVEDYTKDGQKTIFDNAEIITHRDDAEIITQSLVIKLRVPERPSSPIEVRASLLGSSVTSGCYMIYSTNATVIDPHINEIKDLNILAGWMTIDVMGNSMANLLAYALGRGLGDYPQMFDHKFSSD